MTCATNTVAGSGCLCSIRPRVTLSEPVRCATCIAFACCWSFRACAKFCLVNDTTCSSDWSSLLQIKAFINEAHYYADATIMFPVWPPESKQKYTCGHLSSETSAQRSDNESNSCHNTTNPVSEQVLNSFRRAVRCPEGIAVSPEQEVTGWGIWMAEKLWAEIQWQYKQAHTASTASLSCLA